ncbi:MAG: imidazoleglycerol-phosphate dehydratase HisB [Clostridiales Family XIII bacterium]|jgi:imidazoleglycerol-phosphate dehydratase|nr:imidazoleglycerol-phosphate dehydratase HisB [Clostridiales Family XIII bacterium]
MRVGEILRQTKETDIRLRLSADGSGRASVDTGIGFFDHMLTAFAAHSGFDLDLCCKGDLSVDGHHTVEDVGISLGLAFAEAIDGKEGIARYGNFTVPMDESLASCSIDICGRSCLVFNAGFARARLGRMDTQTVKEFFLAFASNAKVTLHINVLYGENDHHKCEAVFKAFAHAVKEATRLTGGGLLSTKGVL